MSIQNNYVIGIISHEKIPEMNRVIFSYSDVTMESTSHMYFGKQPVNPNNFVQDATFFQLNAEDESSLNKKVNDLISDLDKLNGITF